MSLRRPADTFTVTGLGVPFLQYRPTLENWRTELSVAETYHALLNSTGIAVATTVLALLLGVPAAYALARFRFHLIKNKDIVTWFLSQRVLPPVVTVLPFYLIMRTLHLLDTQAALIIANTTFNLPFAVVILRQTFLDLPLELEEAALVDGATPFSTFWHVARPLAQPAIMAAGLIILAFTWNEFLFALTIGRLDAITLPVRIAGTAYSVRGVQFWYVSTQALLAIIPPTVLALLAQRYVVRGLTLGAVKG
ncbi:MAG: carbohydrate ABC transporter permease [Deinococcus sp.]|nr:carbohydrate ABC transporter permease [Deinococcus sp.]